MDELHQQTVNLLSFQGFHAPSTMRRRPITCSRDSARARKGEPHRPGARIRRHYDALGGGRWPLLDLQAIAAPVFHGHTFSISIELERPLDIATDRGGALSGEHVELVLEETDSPSNLAATGQNDVLVRLRAEQDGRNPTQASRLWLWAASDNLRLYAQNALECALELRKLRPHGKVQ